MVFRKTTTFRQENSTFFNDFFELEFDVLSVQKRNRVDKNVLIVRSGPTFQDSRISGNSDSK